MMQVRQLVDAMEQIAPVGNAEPWDNVGLLVGDPQARLLRVMLTIDYTSPVSDEARENKCDAVIAYHPPIFEPLKRVTGRSLIFDAIRSGIAIYSPHTALDVAPGGTNDMLADAIALADRRPLKWFQPKATQYRLVTFVPIDAIDRVSSALFAAGAGRIGKYTSCSFRSAGTGTFFGEEGTNPAVGKSGKLERSEEIRLETVVALDRVQAVVEALKKAHPYEEPAIDLNQLVAAPLGIGMGRIGNLPGGATAEMLINRIKRELDIDHVLVAGDMTRLVKRAAACAGACGNLLDDVIAQQGDFYLTGEMRHHDALKALKAEVVVVCTLHSNSERAMLKRLRDDLSRRLPGVTFLLSQQDRDPFVVE